MVTPRPPRMFPRRPMSRIRSFLITMAPFLITGPPLPSKYATWSITRSSSGGCCAEAARRASMTPLRAKNAVRRLFLDILLFPFIDQDLQPLLREKWKHDESTYRIAPPKSHSGINQKSHQKHHGQVRVAECEDRCCF